MPIDIHYEQDYYRKDLVRLAKINAALERTDVQEALTRCPDASGLSAAVNQDTVLISAYVGLGEEPAIAEVADLCDGRAYHLDMRQTLLDVPGVVLVQVHINGSARLQEDERDLLRAIGKLQQETTVREYLACAA